MAHKILVVEDEPEIVTLLELRLKDKGFRVASAEDGAKAMEKVKSEKPDLVIMDVTMPPPNGFQVCRMIKDDPQLRHIPVILLTCKSTESDKFWGMESGADAYETKPYNFPALYKKIQELLKL
ncbi:MAG: response regulator [Candidatus Omnitrophota bacterium]|jgi:DNA-binding response OmpR family regulator